MKKLFSPTPADAGRINVWERRRRCRTLNRQTPKDNNWENERETAIIISDAFVLIIIFHHQFHSVLLLCLCFSPSRVMSVCLPLFLSLLGWERNENEGWSRRRREYIILIHPSLHPFFFASWSWDTYIPHSSSSSSCSSSSSSPFTFLRKRTCSFNLWLTLFLVDLLHLYSHSRPSASSPGSTKERRVLCSLLSWGSKNVRLNTQKVILHRIPCLRTRTRRGEQVQGQEKKEQMQILLVKKRIWSFFLWQSCVFCECILCECSLWMSVVFGWTSRH